MSEAPSVERIRGRQAFYHFKHRDIVPIDYNIRWFWRQYYTTNPSEDFIEGFMEGIEELRRRHAVRMGARREQRFGSGKGRERGF